MENFEISTAGNALKCILSQSKGGNRKIFCSLRLQGAPIHVLLLGLEKLSAALEKRGDLILGGHPTWEAASQKFIFISRAESLLKWLERYMVQFLLSPLAYCVIFLTFSGHEAIRYTSTLERTW